MALTVTEASAVNDLLLYVTGQRRELSSPVTREAAQAAAALLADHAHKTLMAGLTGNDVDEAWPRVRTPASFRVAGKAGR